MQSCNTITWVSSLKPWHNRIKKWTGQQVSLQLSERGIKSTGSRATKIRRLEEFSLDRSLGAVICSETLESSGAEAEQQSLIGAFSSNVVKDGGRDEREAEDELDSVATQPFQTDSASQQLGIDDEIDDKDDDEANDEEGDTRHQAAAPSDSQLRKRIRSICKAQAQGSPTVRNVELQLTKEFGR